MFTITTNLFLLAHFLGDFYFQSEKVAESKEKAFGKLALHSLLYLLIMILIVVPVLGLTFLAWGLFLSSLHFLVDSLKYYLVSTHTVSNKQKIRLYLLDQLIHIVIIVITALLLSRLEETVQYTDVFASFVSKLSFDVESVLTWALALIIILKPVSITIRKILSPYQPKTEDANQEGFAGAGSLIGILERLLILIMIAQNDYAAIGFILTAKSIARYNKLVENPQFSEYYLLGTLLSIVFVITTHLLIIA